MHTQQKTKEAPPQVTPVAIKKKDPVPTRNHAADPPGLPGWFAKLIRRRQFIVNPSLQLQLIANTVTALLLFFFVTAFAVFFPLVQELQAYDNLVSNNNLAVEPLLYLHENFWSLSLLSMAAVVCLTVHSSHKVAGPLYRFNQTFRQISEGKIAGSIKLRKGDYLGNEEEEFNKMLASLNDNLSQVKNAEAELRQEISRLRDATTAENNQELHATLQGLASLETKLEQSLQHFEVTTNHE